VTGGRVGFGARPFRAFLFNAMNAPKRRRSPWVKRPEYPGPLIDIIVLGFLLLVVLAQLTR
jgi:hypothetical protein